MGAELETGPVLKKTVELCEVLVSQPAFAAFRRDIDVFMEDEVAMRLYREVAEQSQQLSFKQNNGTGLTQDEIARFEEQRQTLLGNEVARAFIDAQEQLHHVQQTVSRYLNKTIELGRVPNPEDFGTCGHGCQCGG